MEPTRFDALTRTLSAVTSRRRGLGALLTALGASLLLESEITARRRKAKGKDRKRDNGNGRGERKRKNRKQKQQK